MATNYSGIRLLILAIVLLGTFVLMFVFVWPRLQEARRVRMPEESQGMRQVDPPPGGTDGGNGPSSAPVP